MRHLSEVLDRMIAFVPLEQASLLVDLTNLRSSLGFVAPEMMPLRWANLEVIVNCHIPQPPAGLDAWQNSFVMEFIGKATQEPK